MRQKTVLYKIRFFIHLNHNMCDVFVVLRMHVPYKKIKHFNIMSHIALES